jgi:hypothetical protein
MNYVQSMYLKSYTVYVSIYNGATTELVDCCKRNVEIDSFLTVRPTPCLKSLVVPCI